MKKLTHIKVRSREISTGDLEGTLESAISCLQEYLDELEPGEINLLDWESDRYYEGSGGFVLTVYREETDEEFEKRKVQQKLDQAEALRRKADQKLKADIAERKLYEELKRKFE